MGCVTSLLNGAFPDGEIVQLFVSLDATGVAALFGPE